MTATPIQILSEYIAAAGAEPLPEAVVRKARHHTLDTLAAAVSGARLRPGRLAIEYVAGQATSGCSTVVGALEPSTPALAALANGMSAHADETDDSHERSLSHPGCGIVPAALAAAEAADGTVQELLRAVTLGYDVGTRVIFAIGLEHLLPWEPNFSSHAFVCAFGGAAAASVAWQLRPDQVAWALSYAAQQASGITTFLRDQTHVEKAFAFGGMPARNGVAAAEMVASGFDGVDDVFAGRPNFLEILSPSPDPEQLVHGLGSRFEVTRTNIKKYPVGSPAQAVLQALDDLRAAEPVSVDDVREIEVVLPADAAPVVDNRLMPDINVQYLVAGSLIDGGCSFAMAHDYERFQGPEVREVMARVTLVADATMTPKSRQARVRLVLADGRVREHHTPVVRGTWGDPMDDDEVIAKAEDLMLPVLGAQQTRTAIRLVMEGFGPDSARDLGVSLRADPDIRG